MNPKNLPVLFRIALLPIVIHLIYQAEASVSLLALLLIFFAMGTDALSSIISSVLSKWRAKRITPASSTIPPTGSFLEPVADKLLIWGVLLTFAFRSWIWLIPLAVFILRDMIVNILLLYASRDNISIREEPYRQMMKYIQYGIILAIIGRDYLFYLGHFTGMNWLLLAAFALAIAAVGMAVASVVHHSASYRQKVAGQNINLQGEKQGEKKNKSNMIILANRKSGLYHDRYRRHLLRIFARRRNAPLYTLSRGKDLFAPLAGRITRAQQIILAGGDGTFERALNNPLFRGKSLGFFPLGSGNALYAYFYRGKRFEYLRSRFSFREVPLDIIELQWKSSTNDSHRESRYTTFFSTGIDAEVARLRRTRDTGFWGYAAASLRAVFLGKGSWPVELIVDGKKQAFSGCTALTIGKVPYYGFALRSLVGDVNPHDGMLYGVAIVNTHARIWDKAARAVGLLLTSMNLVRPPLVHFKGKEIVIRSMRAFPLQAGGDFIADVREVRCHVARTQKVLAV